MKVLHVIPTLAETDGGPTAALRSMCQGLTQHQVEIHVCTTDGDSQGWRQDVPLNQPMEQYGATVWYFKRQTRFYTASWPLTRWLAHHVADYDLVHIHCLFSYSALPAAFYATRCHIPYIVRPLGTLSRWGMRHRRPVIKQLSFALIERRIIQNAALLHFTSEMEGLEAQAVGVMHPSVVLPLGIDLAPFSALPSPDRFQSRYPQLNGVISILFLGRLGPIKGLDLLLPAFAELRQRGVAAALVLAGNGDIAFINRLRLDADRLGIAGDIVWPGFLSGETKLSALANADIFVLPSYSESFGIATIEAMACGKPVIISDQVPTHREVAKADAGLVVPCDANALAGALSRLAHNTDLRYRMGANGWRLAHESFSLQAMTTSLLSVYRDTMWAPARSVR